MELLANLFAILFFAAILALIVSIIKPSLTLKFLPQEKQTRLNALKYYGIGSLFLLAALGIALPSPESTKEEVQVEVSETIPEQVAMPITLDQYIDRYNASFENLRQPNTRVSIIDEKDNGKSIIAQIRANHEYFGMVIGADNQSRKVQSITYIGSGDGSAHSGTQVLFGVVAVIMAIEDPDMNVDERGQILTDLDIENLSKDHPISLVRNGIQYNLSMSEYTGVMLIAEPQK